MGGRGAASNLGKKLDKVNKNEDMGTSGVTEVLIGSYKGISKVVDTTTSGETAKRRRTTKTIKRAGTGLFGGTGSGENTNQEERKRKRYE